MNPFAQGEVCGVAQDKIDSNLEGKFLSSDRTKDETKDVREPKQIVQATSGQGQDETPHEVEDLKIQGPAVTDFHATGHDNVLGPQSHQYSVPVVASLMARTHIIKSSDRTDTMQKGDHSEIAEGDNSMEGPGESSLGKNSYQGLAERSDTILEVMMSANAKALPHKVRNMLSTCPRGHSCREEEVHVEGDLVYKPRSIAMGIPPPTQMCMAGMKHEIWLIVTDAT